MNYFKTFLLMFALTALLMGIGGLVGGQEGMVLAFLFALLMNFASYWFSDKIVLAMYRAKEARESDYPDLYAVVQKLAQAAAMPVPRIYVVPSPVPNAFATGRNPAHAVVAVTDGIMQTLTARELEGVLAHELSHVKHRDILISTIAATIAGAIMMLANMARWSAMFGGYGGRDDREGGRAGGVALLVTVLLAPLAAMLIQMAISRSREFGTDEGGAHLCRDPLALAGALTKLEQAGKMGRTLQANPATAHLFIVNPLRGQSLASLFSTHPPTAERVARLEKIAKTLK